MMVLFFKIRSLPPDHPISRVAVVALERQGDRVRILVGQEWIADIDIDSLESWIAAGRQLEGRAIVHRDRDREGL